MDERQSAEKRAAEIELANQQEQQQRAAELGADRAVDRMTETMNRNVGNRACSISYSDWSRCNWDGVQTRFVISAGIRSCEGGQRFSEAVTTRSCNYLGDPAIDILKEARLNIQNSNIAIITSSVIADITNNHNRSFQYSYLTGNTIYPSETIGANRLVHSYSLTVDTQNNLAINYVVRPTNNAQPNIFDITLYDTNGDGFGDYVIVNDDYFGNMVMEEVNIRGTWFSIINQYILFYHE